MNSKHPLIRAFAAGFFTTLVAIGVTAGAVHQTCRNIRNGGHRG